MLIGPKSGVNEIIRVEGLDDTESITAVEYSNALNRLIDSLPDDYRLPRRMRRLNND